jgi:hypothetical protein
MKIVTSYLVTILVLSVLGENVQKSERKLSLTRYILDRMMRAKSENWCKQFSSETFCHPVFRKMALDKSDYDDNFGVFSIENDNDGIVDISAIFSIWRNSQFERHPKLLVSDRILITLFISGTEEIKDFETKFEFTYKDDGIEKVASDYYTNCKTYSDGFVHKEYQAIYLCDSDLTYDEFIKEIDSLEMIHKAL